jgi:hypothetical protein
MDIRIGVLGRLVAGGESGRYVEVIDETASSDFYEVWTYADRNRSPETFDNWFESLDGIAHFFAFHGWEVDWSDRP